MTQENKFYQQLDYLNKWKPALDTKSVNQIVFSSLKSEISKREDEKIRVLDCGTGTGRGLVRLIEEGVLKKAEVEAFDISGELISDMPRLFQEHAVKNRWEYKPVSYDQSTDFMFTIQNDVKKIDVKIHGFQQSAYELPKRTELVQNIDVVTGQAFIEHVNQGIVYPILTMLLREGGLMYFSMNCDGWFNYSPSKDRERDEKMVALFNDLALNNQEFKNDFGSIFGGEAFCGRNLPYRFKDYGIETLAFGSSDWVVAPFQQSVEELSFLEYTSTYIRDKCVSTPADEARNKRGLTSQDIYLWHAEKQKSLCDYTNNDQSIGFTCVQKDILGRKIRR